MSETTQINASIQSEGRLGPSTTTQMDDAYYIRENALARALEVAKLGGYGNIDDVLNGAAKIEAFLKGEKDAAE